MARITRSSPGRERLVQAIAGLDGASSRVGWFESAKYKEDGKPVAGIAAAQEFGTKTIPPRPFVRPTATAKEREWAGIAKQVSVGVVRGVLPAYATVEAVALQAEADVRVAITQLMAPPLKPSTVKARARRHSKGKSSTKPLIDTGYMLSTLTSEVEKK